MIQQHDIKIYNQIIKFHFKKWNFENDKKLSQHENYFYYELSIVIFQKKTMFKKGNLLSKEGFTFMKIALEIEGFTLKKKDKQISF